MEITRSLLPQNQGKLPSPLFGGNFWVILHDFIIQNYHKTQSNLYPFYLIKVNYPILLKWPHFIFQKNQDIIFPKKIPEQFIKNG